MGAEGACLDSKERLHARSHCCEFSLHCTIVKIHGQIRWWHKITGSTHVVQRRAERPSSRTKTAPAAAPEPIH